jgi:hypothetical protein
VTSFIQGTDGRFALKGTTQNVGASSHCKAADQRGNVGLIINREISGPSQIAPNSIRPIAKSKRIDRLGRDHQLGRKDIATVTLPSERL